MKKIFPLLAITLSIGCITACTNNPRSQEQFDTNAAEAAETPGQLAKGDAETNAQAEAKVPADYTKHSDKAHPALKDIPGEKTAVPTNSFAAKAAEAGQTEVTLGNLAVQKTANKKIKEFAQMMMKDHSATNEQLKALAKQKGIVIPEECTTCEASLKTFHDMNTEEFDQRYVQQMVQDHEAAVALFTTASQNDKDADLKKFATEKLPVLKHHLQMAKELASMKGVDTHDTHAAVKETPKEEPQKSKKELRKERRKERKAKG